MSVLQEGGSIKLLNKQELKQRCISEGIRYTSVLAVNNTEFANAGSVLLGPFQGNSNFKDFYIDNIFISTNTECSFTLEGGITLNTSGNEFGLMYVTKGTMTLPYDYLSRKNMYEPRFSVNFTEFMPSSKNAYPSSTSLSVVKSGLTTVGSGFTYTVTVTNNGAATSGTVTITDFLPDGLLYQAAAGTGWTFNYTNGTLVATTPDVIASAGTKTFTVTVFTSKKIRFYATAVGYLVDHDINYDAPAIVWNGTSITAASSPSSYKQAYTYLIRNRLRDSRNINTRVINRAVAGSTSSFHEAARAFDNRYDLPETPWAAIWEHGINDNVQGVPVETTVANAIAYYRHFRRLNPKTWVFIFAPYPNGNSPIEAGLVILRAALKAALLPLVISDPYLKYLESMGSLFPISQEATYLADKTHLNDAGNALVAEAFAAETTGLIFKQVQ